MKRTIILSILTILIISCQSNSNFNEKNRFYKGIENEKELYVTFINDTVVAINSDSLKTCSWIFKEFKYNKNGLYKTNELKTDTVWLKPKGKKIELTQTNKKLIFERIDLPKSEIAKIQKEIEISQNFAEKGILYECEYTIKEVGYFYERAIQEVKDKLKNPSSAKFNKAYIHKQSEFNENSQYVETNNTLVSLNVEAKNGFGNFTESKYYVFFIPKQDDSSKYDIKFSDSPILESDLKDRLKSTMDEAIDELESLDLEE
ncbi:hypothetical protein [Psychroserpens jangbogonensis]|uniref:hypothetical protein n=1 Tax=Psychroserpens jangbogonensis TaxID=1484460 RepID=UPI00053EF6E0|nr:hypothetical protein [Psychroserpens jangbogonensis]